MKRKPDTMLEKVHRRTYSAYKATGQHAKAEEVRQLVLRVYGIDLAS